METPKVVHCKREKYDEYIGRPSKWGNPFTHIDDRKTAAKYIVADRDAAVAAYREWILNGEGRHLLKDLHELEGKVLGCWCAPKACHGEVLIEIINQKKMTLEEAKTKLIELLEGQVADLTLMSKIELGDDVIAEIKRLKEIINAANPKDV